MNQLRTLIFTATYNEVENIVPLIAGIQKYVPDADILVIDDNSPDGTSDLLRQLQKNQNNLFIITRERKYGLGSAHSFAMLFAILNNYDYLVTMDADLSHDPQYIPKLILELNNNSYPCDFVIGSRYVQGGGCEYEGYRKLLSVGGNQLTRFMTRIPLHEFTTSFRAIRISKLRTINFTWVFNQGYSFFLEVVVALYKSGCRMGEIPIFFNNRTKGYSKIPKLEIFRAMRKLFLLSLPFVGKNKTKQLITLTKGLCPNCKNQYLYKISDASESKTSIRYGCLICNTSFDPEAK